MKRLAGLFISLCIVFTLTACAQTSPSESEAPTSAAPETAQEEASEPAQEEAAEDGEAEATTESSAASTGLIAIVTNNTDQNEEEQRSAEMMKKKYPDRIIHEVWPARFMDEPETMITIVQKIADNPDVKALIINQAVPGTNAAVDKFIESRPNRDDILVLYYEPQEDPPAVAERADIIMTVNTFEMGYAMPKTAAEAGAKTFIHYSFPRHMSQPTIAGRFKILEEECAKLGIEFVALTAPDPMGDAGMGGATMFILEDVPKQIAKYGKDTAFFSTNCGLQIPLITACYEQGAIYPSPCDPSPFHGFPAALGLTSVAQDPETGLYVQDISDPKVMQAAIDETRQILTDAGLEGRFATWPAPASMAGTAAFTEYAIKWMDGQTNGKLDKEILSQCFKDFTGMETAFTPYAEGDNVIENYLMLFMDYMKY